MAASSYGVLLGRSTNAALRQAALTAAKRLLGDDHERGGGRSAPRVDREDPYCDDRRKEYEDFRSSISSVLVVVREMLRLICLLWHCSYGRPFFDRGLHFVVSLVVKY
jgi:hypothetical protein